MNGRASILWSTVGKKVLMATSGLLLIGFLVGHLAGNLQLFLDSPDPFNRYADMLMSLGWALIAIELILLAIFLLHLISGILVYLGNRTSRPDRYQKYESAGASSKKTVASSTMIWTGLILLVFTALHLYTFKWGPGIAEGYVVEIDGQQMRDLHRLVIEVFQDPIYVIWYVAAMALMGFHLRHGFWSALQSLGAYSPRYTPLLYALGLLVALVLSVGFLGIPIWIFVQGGS